MFTLPANEILEQSSESSKMHNAAGPNLNADGSAVAQRARKTRVIAENSFADEKWPRFTRWRYCCLRKLSSNPIAEGCFARVLDIGGN